MRAATSRLPSLACVANCAAEYTCIKGGREGRGWVGGLEVGCWYMPLDRWRADNAPDGQPQVDSHRAACGTRHSWAPKQLQQDRQLTTGRKCAQQAAANSSGVLAHLGSTPRVRAAQESPYSPADPPHQGAAGGQPSGVSWWRSLSQGPQTGPRPARNPPGQTAGAAPPPRRLCRHRREGHLPPAKLWLVAAAGLLPPLEGR
jgi:hypothetical protein